MITATEELFGELLRDKRKFAESLLMVEDKARRIVPFKYNKIQSLAYDSQTGRDIYVKPSQVGFSTAKIAERLIDTLTNPGTNTVLVAYEDFITERLLSKVTFFYYHLASLRIPNFPAIKHNSTYEKTFEFKDKFGNVITKSSIYIASARSKTAGRAETIHHLLLDEMAFYVKEAKENIIAPALARVPDPEGTVDIFSTPNGEVNDFCDMYKAAVEGTSVFKPHFYPWFWHEEYFIPLGDHRIRKFIPDTDSPEFNLMGEEAALMYANDLSYDQIRWRRWKQLEMESLRRRGDIETLFIQEFPEDDVTCFLATGQMYYEPLWVEEIAATCYETDNITIDGLHIWYPPEENMIYEVIIDPGQAKITQSAIGVMCWKNDALGNSIPYWCARDAGWYSPEITAKKAVAASDLYNRAEIVWEANSHGLAITELLKHRRPIYFRSDIISGIPTQVPGWLTGPSTKDYMLNSVKRNLTSLVCHDIELVRQLRNLRQVGDKIQIVGLDDIHDTLAIGLTTHKVDIFTRGEQGVVGWGPKWGKRR